MEDFFNKLGSLSQVVRLTLTRTKKSMMACKHGMLLQIKETRVMRAMDVSPRFFNET